MKTPSTKSVVFFGNEKLATGISQPEPLIRQAAQAAGFLIEVDITERLTGQENFNSGLAILAAYGQILPPTLLAKFPLGIINVHPSLLPTYRGPTPIEQAILDGASQTGVTLMKIAEKMDSGPIYAQSQIALTGQESKASLANRLQGAGGKLVYDWLLSIFEGQLSPIPQSESKASYSHKIKRSDGQIDWSKPAKQLEREIRAYLGWPGSYSNLLGADIIIIQATIEPLSGQPGQVKTNKNELIVCCGQEALRIERLKPAGKREMSAQEFLAGRRV
jgi:methionyl-tRNA formyltransferase